MSDTTESTKPLTWREAWRCPWTWGVAVISLGLLAWVLWHASLGEVWKSLRSADYSLIILGIPVILAGLVLRAMRWRILLLPLGKPFFWPSFKSLAVGYLGNNLLPARAGELVRAYVLGQQVRISKSSILGTIVVERAVDGTIMLLTLLSLLVVFPAPAWIHRLAAGGTAIFVGAIVILIAIRSGRECIISLLHSLLSRLPKQWQTRGLSLVNDFLVGLTSFRGLTDALVYSLVTMMVWSADVLFFWLVMQAFNISLTIPAVLFTLAAAALSTTIPALPGYVGTYQFVVVSVLTFLGVLSGPATAFALGVHGVTWLTVNTVGACIFLGMLKDLTALVRSVAAES